jgi:hypothetical protein
MPATDGGTHVYQSRNRRWLIAASLVALLISGSSLVLEKDPETGLRPAPSDYLWVVIPGAVLLLVLAWRALKVQVSTDSAGVEIVRVVGRERVPWRRLRRFEVHPTPGRQGSVVVARRDDEVLVKVWTEIMVRPVFDRDVARALARARADELAAVLERDRVDRQARLSPPAGGTARPPGAGARPPGTSARPPDPSSPAGRAG